jgi:glycosyltransferase involved in cell wall biosynthesis
VVIGDGPEAPRLQAAARLRPWLICAGAQTGASKAALFRLAELQLNPGGVGLHALDAFAAGLPMVTLRHSHHGPEFVYLHDGENARVVQDDNGASFAAAIIGLLNDQVTRRRLASGALRDADRYSLDAMASNFCHGVLACLSSQARARAPVVAGP